jgi:aryl-alcohol dehydrogenase-like predicted oxidoreductase
VQDLVVKEGIGAIPYYGLAAGFLTGKYREESDLAGKARGNSVSRYLNDKGLKILSALDEVAGRTGAALSEIALAWIIAQPGITGPISSATSVSQLQSLARAGRLVLSNEDLKLLSEAGK